MTPDYIDHNRANGAGAHPGNGALSDGPRETRINWTAVVAAVLAVIVLGIAFVLIT